MDQYRVGNIVRHKASGEIFEIIEVRGTSAIGKPINEAEKARYGSIVLILDTIELLLDEPTDAFNTLYKVE